MCRRETAPGIDRRAGGPPASFAPRRSATHEAWRLTELDRQERDAVQDGTDVEDGDDVGVREPRHDLRLAHEARLVLRCPVQKELQRHFPIEGRVVSRVDDAHAAAAEAFEDRVATERGAALESVDRSQVRDRLQAGGFRGDDVRPGDRHRRRARSTFLRHGAKAPNEKVNARPRELSTAPRTFYTHAVPLKSDPRDRHRDPHPHAPKGDGTLPLEAPDAGTGWCLLLLDRGAVRHCALPVTGKVVLGRAEDAHVRLHDPSISRRHTVVYVGDDGVEVEDGGSTNGTKFRGKFLGAGERVKVGAGDVLQLGGVICRVERAAPAVAKGEFLVGTSPAITELYRKIDKVAPGRIHVLILGETGVGKDVVARAIHQRSLRRDRPFVALNCAELTESLAESELFGHERGAFTGAANAKPGLIERADGGTLFLDRGRELPLSIQVKLLPRARGAGRSARVGGVTARAINVRIVSATNRNLDAEAARGAFRRDLIFRLAGITLRVPPLRERPDEIEPLARFFARESAAECGRTEPAEFHPLALAVLRGHSWTGNVRELRNVVERALPPVRQAEVITAADLSLDPQDDEVARRPAA